MTKSPTWLSLHPPVPSFLPVTEEDAATVISAVGQEGTVTEMASDSDHQKLYRFDAKSGEPLFVRIVAAKWAADAEESETLAAWLAEQGVSAVPAPIPGFPKRLASGAMVSASAFVKARPLQATPEAMQRFGKRLSDLHSALARHPQRPEWENRTQHRLSRLSEIRAKLATGDMRAGPDPERAAAIAADATIDFNREHEDRQPLHGDLNAGNVLWTGDDLFFIDFEDVVHSVLPPAFELALVLERHVLVQHEDAKSAIEAGSALLAGYGGQRPIRFDLVAHLRALALRSLCVLADAEQDGHSPPASEWQKFFQLEMAARNRAETLAEIGWHATDR